MSFIQITKYRFCLAASLIFLSGSALAQEAPATQAFGFRDISVNKPMGLRLDPFDYRGLPKNVMGADVQASLKTTVEITDNVRAEEKGDSDIVTILNPILDISKKIGRHVFGVGADITIKQHFENNDENTENGTLYAGAEIEATQSLKFPVFIGFSNLALPRESVRVSNPNALTKTPVEQNVAEARVGIDYKPNRFGIETTLGYREVRFDDNQLLSGARSIQKDRDHDQFSIQTDLTYDFTSSLQPRLSFIFEDQDFLRNTFTNGSFNGDDRSNKSITVLAGGRWNYKNLIIGDIGIGTISRQYEDSNIEDTNDLSFRGKLIWEPTQRTHIEIDAGRSTIEDNLIIAGLTRTNIETTIDYEIKRDMFIRGFLGYTDEDFTETSRTDETYETGLEYKYILSPYLQLGAGYRYSERNSPIGPSNYENNKFMVSLTGAL